MEKEQIIHRVVQTIGVPIEKIYSIFLYGSRVYGTATANSDYDLCVIADSEMDHKEFKRSDVNIHVYKPATFRAKLENHDIVALECVFAPEFAVILNNVSWIQDVAMNASKLRHAFSEKASNSWVKAKKKLEVENEPYLGKKSLFHALRILKFGIQLAKAGEITHYQAANKWYQEIMYDNATDWKYFKEKYQPIYNKLCTEFRILAPKA